jgi:glycosyltransferase involved in cell wall biosynthesis
MGNTQKPQRYSLLGGCVKKKIFVRGPVLSQSGYGEQARFALRALKSREDIFDIYVQPVPWGRTGWVWENNEFRDWLDKRISDTAVAAKEKRLQPDISLQITIPNEFEKLCPINIGYTAGIETNRVAPQWLQKGNEMDKVLVVSNHAKDTFVNTVYEAQNNQTGEVFPYKLQTDVEVVWENTPRSEPEPIEGFEPEYDFNFVMVSQLSPRKNFSDAVRWWVEEFIDQEVGLILKSNLKCNSYIDFEMFQKSLKHLLSAYPDRKCKVHLLHGDLTSGQMTSLYRHPKVKAIINISHGEGFGLPLYEAAREGLPVVSIGWSGQLDFLTHDGENLFQKVEHTLAPVQPGAVWDGVIQQDSHWAYADQGSYKMTLRKTYKTWHKAKEKAEKLKTIIEDNFSDQVLFKRFVNCIHQDNSDWLLEIQDIIEEYE